MVLQTHRVQALLNKDFFSARARLHRRDFRRHDSPGLALVVDS